MGSCILLRNAQNLQEVAAAMPPAARPRTSRATRRTTSPSTLWSLTPRISGSRTSATEFPGAVAVRATKMVGRSRERALAFTSQKKFSATSRLLIVAGWGVLGELEEVI